MRGNVLLIAADQWRGDTLGCVGHPCIRTPNLDRLAAGATLFRRHFAQASPCGPSRASLLTGLYLMNHRSVGNGAPLDTRHATLAHEVRKAGYEPTLFGYTDTTIDPRAVPAGDPRLETYEGLLPGMAAGLFMTAEARPWRAWLAGRGYDGPLGHPEVYAPRTHYPGAALRGATFAPARYSAGQSDTAFLADAALDWLQVNSDRPWFLHLAFLRPHPPWVAPEPYHAMYDPDEVPPPVRPASREDAAAQHPMLRWLLGFEQRRSFFPDGDGPAAAASERDVLQARATYYGLMTEVDHHVGRVLDWLERSGQSDRTLVIFTSDHGEQLGDFHLFGKRGYRDPSFHIPLIIRDPRARVGRRQDAFTEAVDIMPTILDWLSLPVPPACDGETLLPLLEGEAPAGWRAEAHWEYDFRGVRDLSAETELGLKPDQCALGVIRGDRWKYVHFTALPPLLFDLREDPYELRNLAGDPACRPVMLEFAQKMLSWRMAHAERTLANMQAGPGGIAEWRGPRH